MNEITSSFFAKAVVDDEMVEDLAQAEQKMGATPEKARELAQGTTRKMMDSFVYPEKPEPKKDVPEAVLAKKVQSFIMKSKSRAK